MYSVHKALSNKDSGHVHSCSSTNPRREECDSPRFFACRRKSISDAELASQAFLGAFPLLKHNPEPKTKCLQPSPSNPKTINCTNTKPCIFCRPENSGHWQESGVRSAHHGRRPRCDSRSYNPQPLKHVVSTVLPCEGTGKCQWKL